MTISKVIANVLEILSVEKFWVKGELTAGVMMGESVQISTKDDHTLDAFIAEPASAPKGALIVIQEIFGVNSHIRNVTEQFADAGYVSIAPALFDRIEKNVDLGYGESDFARGHGIWEQVTDEMFLADTEAARDYVKGIGKVGVIGYCFGGYVAWASACKIDGLACGISFYGGRVTSTTEWQPKCPVQFHFADNDAYIPLADVALVKEAHPDLPLYVYDGTSHGFCCGERDDYDRGACDRATKRALEFLARHAG